MENAAKERRDWINDIDAESREELDSFRRGRQSLSSWYIDVERGAVGRQTGSPCCNAERWFVQHCEQSICRGRLVHALAMVSLIGSRGDSAQCSIPGSTLDSDNCNDRVI